MKIQHIASAAALLLALGVGYSVSANADTNASGSTTCPLGQVVDVGTTQCVNMPAVGLGFDMKFAGSTKEEHVKFHKSLKMEDQEYIASVCKVSYKNRTAQEKVFCADIL